MRLFSHLELLDLYVVFYIYILSRGKWQQRNVSQHLGERPIIQHQSSRSKEPLWQIRKGELSLHVFGSSSGPLYVTTSHGIEAFCSEKIFGQQVLSAKVVTNARSPGSKCYGLVAMSTGTEVTRCISHLDCTELHGQEIFVERVRHHWK